MQRGEKNRPSERLRREPRGGTDPGSRWGMAAVLSVGLGLLLTACGSDAPPAPGYKSAPPVSAGGSQPAKTAPLAGFVYMAESMTLDPRTQLPEGYRLVPGNEGRVTVRIPGTPSQTRVVPILEGAYTLPDLPVGVALEVTASYPGMTQRRQAVTIVLPAGRRLNFDHDPDGSSSFLLQVQAPT